MSTQIAMELRLAEAKFLVLNSTKTTIFEVNFFRIWRKILRLLSHSKIFFGHSYLLCRLEMKFHNQHMFFDNQTEVIGNMLTTQNSISFFLRRICPSNSLGDFLVSRSQSNVLVNKTAFVVLVFENQAWFSVAHIRLSNETKTDWGRINRIQAKSMHDME